MCKSNVTCKTGPHILKASICNLTPWNGQYYDLIFSPYSAYLPIYVYHHQMIRSNKLLYSATKKIDLRSTWKKFNLFDRLCLGMWSTKLCEAFVMLINTFWSYLIFNRFDIWIFDIIFIVSLCNFRIVSIIKRF